MLAAEAQLSVNRWLIRFPSVAEREATQHMKPQLKMFCDVELRYEAEACG